MRGELLRLARPSSFKTPTLKSPSSHGVTRGRIRIDPALAAGLKDGDPMANSDAPDNPFEAIPRPPDEAGQIERCEALVFTPGTAWRITSLWAASTACARRSISPRRPTAMPVGKTANGCGP